MKISNLMPLGITALVVMAATFALLSPGSRAATSPSSAAYLANCAACHQANGKGIPGIFPALAGGKLVKGAPAAVVQVVLAGRNGMPSFRSDLDDAQLAAAISYVRQSWGNNASAVTPAFIQSVRLSTNNMAIKNRETSN